MLMNLVHASSILCMLLHACKYLCFHCQLTGISLNKLVFFHGDGTAMVVHEPYNVGTEKEQKQELGWRVSVLCIPAFHSILCTCNT